jgi:hypothetical protein
MNNIAQIPMFEALPVDLPVLVSRARRSDPMSSHAAAKMIEVTGILGAQQAQALAAVLTHPGCTSMELAAFVTHGRLPEEGQRNTAAIRDERYRLARRLPELEAAAKVRKGVVRPCRVAQRPAVEWWPAAAAGNAQLPDEAAPHA